MARGMRWGCALPRPRPIEMPLLNANQTGTAVLAVAVQNAASEIWHAYVPAIMPGLSGQYVTELIGVCAAIIIAHLIPQKSS